MYVCLYTSQVPYRARAYPGNTNRLGVFLLPLDRILVHPRVTPSIDSSVPTFIDLGVERHCDSYVSCPRTQHGTQPRFELRQLAPESSALIMRPPCIPSREVEASKILITINYSSHIMVTRTCSQFCIKKTSVWSIITTSIDERKSYS